MEVQVTKFTVIIHLNHRDIYNLRWNKIQEMGCFKFISATQPSVQPCHLLDPRWLLLLLSTFRLTIAQNSVKGSYFFFCILFNK